MTENEAVERVAQAMFYAGDKYKGLLWADPENPEARREAFREDARAVIAALDLPTIQREARREALAGLEVAIPDYIEFFRMIREAGRSDQEKAQALADHFMPLIDAIRALKEGIGE